MIIIMIGAGDGTKCVSWLKTFKDALIYAFEPDPRQFEKLIKSRVNCAIHEQRRIKIYNAAVWNKNDVIDFYLCNDPSSSSVLPFVESNIKKWKYPLGRTIFKINKKIKVKGINLQTIINLEKINIVDFLYIDVQGCAKQIFEGLDNNNLKRIKEILIKLHTISYDIYEKQTTLEDIENYLKRYYFVKVESTPYSKNQEVWVRFHSIIWKETRNAKIYNIE